MPPRKPLPPVPWYRSLRVRIFFLIIWLGVGTIIILTTLFLDHERQALERELEKRAVQMARMLSLQSAESLIYEDRFGLYELAKTYLQDNGTEKMEGPLIDYLAIGGPSGNVLVALRRPGRIRSAPPTDPPLRGALEAGSIEIVKNDSNTLDVIFPILVQNHPIGAARLGISRRTVESTLDDLRRRVILYVGIIVVGGVLLGLWLAHHIISPVRTLTRGASRLANGHWGEEIEVRSRDEIGELARTLNDLSRRLRESLDEIRRTQESLVRAEKLSALGTLSAGLAHEIKNPLTSLKMILQAMAQDPGDTQTRTQDLKVMLLEVAHMDQILTRFLEFAKPSPLQAGWHTIHILVEEALGLVGLALTKGNIRTHKRIEKDLPKIWVDGGKLRQALVNLFLNAIEAMPQGGDLWIRASRVEQGSFGVILEVEDSGVGVAQELAASIFDPFVTSKEKGTGLGLSVVHRIVAEHRGTVELVPKKAPGARFRIFLPAGGEHGDHPRGG